MGDRGSPLSLIARTRRQGRIRMRGRLQGQVSATAQPTARSPSCGGHVTTPWSSTRRSATSIQMPVPSRAVVGGTLAGLAEMPELQRRAFVMTALAGSSHEEAAATLGVSDGAVRGMVYRARGALRHAAAALLPGPLWSWAARSAHRRGRARRHRWRAVARGRQPPAPPSACGPSPCSAASAQRRPGTEPGGGNPRGVGAFRWARTERRLVAGWPRRQRTRRQRAPRSWWW